MNLEELEKSFFARLEHVRDAHALEALRIEYVGRERGTLTNVLRSLKDMPIEEKRTVGPAANALRDKIELALAGKLAELQSMSSVLSEVDVTRPGAKVHHGHLHPLTLVEEKILRIFRSLNFSVIEGPEVESEYYNFDALNIPPNHPSREMWDTFWLKTDAKNESENINHAGKSTRSLLRTHTSPMQVRFMEQNKPPFQIVMPGRVFRYEATDATHEVNFYQVDGLMVGKDVSVANFKYVVETFFKKFFGTHINFRYRPSYFPFTEPSIEVDIGLKNDKWLEVMGSGMVHQNVFKAAGYKPGEWQGFAFGVGVDRLAMIKYGIPDIRLFYSGDLRVIEQF